MSIKNLKTIFFQDKHGQPALTAAPNLPLIVWAAATVAGKLFKHGALHNALSLLGFTAIVLWALLEIFQGASYFRRLLGVVVLAISILNKL